MAEMLVDSTNLDACLDAEADAIRAKTGGSADIPFDFANSKGFADAIAAIPSGGSSIPDFTLAGTQTITESVSQVTFSIPSGTTQLLIVISATITASRKSYFYWYFNNSNIFYYSLSASSMSARNAIYGKMIETGGQSDVGGVTIAGASVGTVTVVPDRDLSVGGTLKLTGYYSDSQLTGGTISVYWR